ncbi:uncharacterized protein TRIADDRAFT_60263 [Trichoplax adhaerens]|uniref:Uncharacterized protein n=1 Tax=Trichoplax adhaerens TaxID=10228 RepID=B3S7R4_TRIAD|nr:hypothetical protein TRIADDRAFT_60263 [Trichoplax adhaerens]EDV21337.1 hypothetical protein TRIADDRAFT_60263 [Trichoplax adhaerens]|eukprot:XP_002116304.1 hypothetical protein TRIADDRAFT_60263 [Trichoplax adhaerens]
MRLIRCRYNQFNDIPVLSPRISSQQELFVDIYIGQPNQGSHPLAFQLRWLREVRHGQIDSSIHEALSKLFQLANGNNLPLEQLIELFLSNPHIDSCFPHSLQSVQNDNDPTLQFLHLNHSQDSHYHQLQVNQDIGRIIDQFVSNDFVKWIYDKAIDIYKQQVKENDNPHAYYQLGYIYHYGLSSIGMDANKAFKCYRSAVNKNHPGAQFMLYQLYSSQKRCHRLSSRNDYCTKRPTQVVTKCPSPEILQSAATMTETASVETIGDHSMPQSSDDCANNLYNFSCLGGHSNIAATTSSLLTLTDNSNLSHRYVKVIDNIQLIELKVKMYVKAAATGKGYTDAYHQLSIGYDIWPLWREAIHRLHSQLLETINHGNRSNQLTQHQLADTYNQLGFLTLFLNITNIEVDNKKALLYFNKAAALGNPSGYYNIAEMYSQGYTTGISLDQEECEMIIINYRCSAAEHGHHLSQFLMGLYYTHYQENLIKSSYYFIRSLQYGYAATLSYITFYYFHGWGGVKQDFHRAYLYCLLSATANDYDFAITGKDNRSEAYDMLGYMYEHGLGVEVNYQTSLQCYAQAARLGNLQSCCCLAKLIEKGKADINDRLTNAVQLYKFAAASTSCVQGYANYRLGKLYRNNQNIDFYDQELAKIYFKQACNFYQQILETARPAQLYHLGIMHQYGYGTDIDKVTASNYYKNAINQSQQSKNIFDLYYSKKAKKRYEQLNIHPN